MTEPTQSASVQPGILQRQKAGTDETGLHVVDLIQGTGVDVALAAVGVAEVGVAVAGGGVVNVYVNAVWPFCALTPSPAASPVTR